MNEWQNINADGIALAFWLGIAGLVFLVIAKVVEWRRPRLEREFEHLARLERYRQAQPPAAERPRSLLPWSPPSKWIDERGEEQP